MCQCCNNETFQISVVVFNKTAAATSILGNFLDHVNVTATADAKGVYSDVVFASQTLLNYHFSVADLAICQKKDTSFLLVL